MRDVLCNARASHPRMRDVTSSLHTCLACYVQYHDVCGYPQTDPLLLLHGCSGCCCGCCGRFVVVVVVVVAVVVAVVAVVVVVWVVVSVAVFFFFAFSVCVFFLFCFVAVIVRSDIL